jgi:hypothetical protein
MWAKRIGKFMVEMCKTWGAGLTGGFLIALSVSWQLTGHSISIKAGWGIIICAIVIAAFQVWNRQLTIAERVQQELMEEKHTRSNPFVMLHFHPLQPLTQADLEFCLIGEGGQTAFNVLIQPIEMPCSTATFDELTKVTVAEWANVKPTIRPVSDPKYKHDFIVMLHNQPLDFITNHRTPESAHLPYPIVAIPVEITYMNQTGKEWFMTKMEILFDFDPLRNYIDARLIESKPLLHPLHSFPRRPGGWPASLQS